MGYNEAMSWNLIGHEWAVALLQSHIRNGNVRHAYLFTGPDGVGRRTLALRFAQALVCENPPSKGEACGKCRNCRQIERMTHPDLAIVRREEGSSVIKVEQVRALERLLSLSPLSAPYRIGLLLDFERANPAAANALLKTLEEPPPSAILLLTAESAEALLPTVVSRCEVVRLRPVPTTKIAAALQKRLGLTEEGAVALAQISGGRPGYALALHKHPELLEERREALDSLWEMVAADRIERFARAAEWAKDRRVLSKILTYWLSFWRDVLVRSAGAEILPANPDKEMEIEALAAVLTPQEALQIVRRLTQALEDLDHFVNTRLVAENIMLALPRVQ